MTELFVHVGYDKTGTTTLQKNIFPNLTNVNYLGRMYKEAESSLINRISQKIQICLGLNPKVDSIEELPYAMHITAYDISFLNNIIKKSLITSEPNLISNEVILRPTSNKKDSVRKIFKIFDFTSYDVKTKIIFTIRNQVDLIKSRIQHNLRYIDYKPNIDYNKLLYQNPIDCIYPACRKYNVCKKNCWEGIKPVSLPFYNFYDTVTTFEKFYKKENIIILPFENIFENSKGLKRTSKLLKTDIQDLKKWISIPRNRSRIGTKINLPKGIENRIREYYLSANESLATRYNLELDKKYFR